MSRHPFSRRKRRRIHAGRIKYYATYETVPGEPDALRVRWGPTDMKPGKETGPAIHHQSRRYPWDPRCSPAPKRRPWTPEEIERFEAGKRLDEVLKTLGQDGPPQYQPAEAGSDAGTSSLDFPD